MMKKNGLYMVLFVLLMAFLFMPMVQQYARPFALRELDGAALKTEKPQLTLDSYGNMSYQTQLEKYVAENFGFREWVIRLYNQYLWQYRKTYAADVVIGKDKWLYGIMGVQNHYRQLAYEFADSNEAMVQQFDKEVKRLKKVQDLFEQRGIRFFVMICPSKDIIYPQYLPEHGKWSMSDGVDAMDYYVDAFAENGIHCLDLCTWFNQIKDTVDYPIFPKSGLHWSDIASVHAGDTLIRYLEQLTGQNMPNIQIGAPFVAKTEYPDNDLEKSMNLIWDIKPNTNLYAHSAIVPDSTARRLSLLTIGDSFFWNFVYTLPMNKVFKSYHHWYYFNSIYFDPNHTSVSQVNLLDEFSNTDVVMLCYNAAKLYDLNCGFLSRALVEMTLDSKALDDIIEAIEIQMKENEQWYEDLKQKAVKWGIDLDQVMHDDALFLINQNPEKYIDQNLK